MAHVTVRTSNYTFAVGALKGGIINVACVRRRRSLTTHKQAVHERTNIPVDAVTIRQLQEDI